MPTPTEIVNAFCDRIAQGDAEQATAFFSDDALYHNIPLDPMTGREAIQATIAMFLGMADKVWFEMVHQLAEGDIVMTERVDHFVMGGRDIGLPVMGTFEVRGGKIVAWRDYFDMNQFTTMMQGE
jgi:limonene-1,2-epoxide hydrolase